MHLLPLPPSSFPPAQPLSITLRGVTNDPVDPSVDVFRTVTLPLLKRLGIEEGLELKVPKRGSRPLGGGEVVLRVPVIRQLPPVNLMDEGEASCRARVSRGGASCVLAG